MGLGSLMVRSNIAIGSVVDPECLERNVSPVFTNGKDRSYLRTPLQGNHSTRKVFYQAQTSSDPMKPTAAAQQTTDNGKEEPAEQEQRTYGCAKTNAGLAFDPTKDLNLPGSYDEVVSRFKKLQGSPSMEALN
jgi:hypothetical protein